MQAANPSDNESFSDAPIPFSVKKVGGCIDFTFEGNSTIEDFKIASLSEEDISAASLNNDQIAAVRFYQEKKK